MNCDACQQRLLEFALEELPGELQEQVANHLAGGCHACNEEFSELLASLALVPLTLDQSMPPARVENDLFARIQRSRAEVAGASRHEATIVRAPEPSEKRRNDAATWKYALAGAIGLAASIALFSLWFQWNGKPVGNGDHGGIAEWQALQKRFDEAERSQRLVQSPDLRFVSTRPDGAVSDVHGYVVWDTAASQAHVHVFNLPPLGDGREYRLWFVTDRGELLPGGRFEVDSSIRSGDSRSASGVVANVPDDTLTIAELAISDQLVDDKAQPDGDFLYVAKLPR